MVERNNEEYNEGDSYLTGWKPKVYAPSLFTVLSATVKRSMRALS
jgi:hypothetical protein